MRKTIAGILISAVLATLSPQVMYAAPTTNFNYGEALQKSIMFYEFQRTGKMPANIRNNWKGDSCVKDGSDNGVDLTGGWFDAGDHVKFNLPMAYTSAMLSWAAYEYKDGLSKSGQLDYLKDQIKWASDYFIKCHTAENEYYYQVGDGTLDHRWWVPGEVIEELTARPSYKVTLASPGSAVTAEAAAALASASLVFKDSDPTYSALCLKHAQQLFNFADTTQSDKGYTAANNFYTSSSFYDDLSWAGAWLYMATNDKNYLDKAESYVSKWGLESQTPFIAFKWGQCWDDVHYGAELLLARLTDKALYKESIERHLDYWTTGVGVQKITYTPKGLAYLTNWGSLRHATTTAFLADIYSDFKGCSQDKAKTYLDFAKSQTDYALGSTGRSFEVGFGVNPPQHPHHRTACDTWADNMKVPDNERHVLYGALVGGPGSSDDYQDVVTDYEKNEVACDYNAGFVGALAKMYSLYGGNPIPNFNAIEQKSKEISVTSAGVPITTGKVDGRVFVLNQSAWPARVCDKLSIKYFMDLSEYIQGGGKPDDISTSITYSSDPVKISKPKVYDATKNIYYVEVDLTGVKIFPAGDMHYKKEVQFSIVPPSGSKWDNTNDFSFKGLGEADTDGTVTKIPVYEEGKLIFGQEPGGGTVDPGTTVTPGDLNGDGKINSTDYSYLKRYILGLLDKSTIGDDKWTVLEKAADTNLDGKINSTDLSKLKKFLLGQIDKL
ncbi:MAG TPA: glycoside hydrolase family 9 protein [Clostridia bacterium]